MYLNNHLKYLSFVYRYTTRKKANRTGNTTKFFHPEKPDPRARTHSIRQRRGQQQPEVQRTKDVRMVTPEMVPPPPSHSASSRTLHRSIGIERTGGRRSEHRRGRRQREGGLPPPPGRLTSGEHRHGYRGLRGVARPDTT